MTIQSGNSAISYTGNAVTTTFAYNFRILANTDVQVFVNSTLKTLTTDYSVTGVGADAGGNIVFVTAPANLTTIYISRSGIALTQLTDYVENDPFPAETHETALDKLTMLLQQLKIIIDKSVHFPAGETNSGLLVAAATRAGQFLKFDTAGNLDYDNIISGTPQDDFIQAGTGAVAKTFQNKCREIVSVSDFGALGNGVADDTAAVNAAIAYAISIGGCTILFDKLCYCTSALTQVSGQAGIKLIGRSNEVVGTPAAGLLFTGTGASGVIFLDILNCESIAIEDMNILYNNSGFAGTLVSLNGSARMQMINCRLQGLSVTSAARLLYLPGVIGSKFVKTQFSGANYLVVCGNGFNGNIFDCCNFDRYVTSAVYEPIGLGNIFKGGFVENRTDNTGAFIFMENASEARGLTISGVWMGDASSASAFTWVRLGTIFGCTISGCYINGTGNLNSTAIYFGGTSEGAHIHGNYIASHDKGIDLNGLVNNFSIHSNSFASMNTEVFNVGTSKVGYYDLVNLQITAGGKGYRSNTLTVSSTASKDIDITLSNVVVILVTTSDNFTINNPTGTTVQADLSIKISNTSGGAMGTITWDTSYRMASWTNPANATSRTIDFAFNGSIWVEKSRTTSDIPN